MPSLQPKPKRSTSWLPNQVAVGMDCSDPEPKNWKMFGYAVDQARPATASKPQQPAAKSDPPA